MTMFNPFQTVGEQNRFGEDNPQAAYDSILGRQNQPKERQKFQQNNFNQTYRGYMQHVADTIFSGQSPDTDWRTFLENDHDFEGAWYGASQFERGNAPDTMFAPPLKWIGV